MKAAWLCLLVWSWGCAGALAANLAPASGAYAGGLGAGAATGAGRTGLGGNPAAFSPGAFGLRIDCHRPYGLEDLQVAEAGLFADAERLGAAVDWRSTGIEGLWREQGYQLAVAGRLLSFSGFPGRLEAGIAAITWRTEWQGHEPEWSANPAAGVIWSPWPRIRAGAFRAGSFPGGSSADRVLHFGFEARTLAWEGPGGGGAQALRLDFRQTGGLPWRTLASLSIRPHAACEFTVGLATPPFQASAGCALSWRGFRVRQALRYHRYLGRTWLSGADWVSGS